MAYLFSATSQNWSAAGWKTIDSNGIMISEASSALTTTTFQSTAAFIPGAITVEGIMIKVKYKSPTATGTISTRLYNATAAAVVAGTTVTCNVSDLFNTESTADGGWCYFKFGSPVTLLAATNYVVQVASSVNSTVAIYVSATTNWARGLVTSTTATPAAGDILYICGDITGAGTTSTTTITFNNTSATSYGGLEVGAYGKLVGQNSASTNYVLTLATGAVFRVGQNGIVEFSTSASRLPASSTFTLTLTCATNAATFMTVRNSATFRAFGASKTRKAKLAADLSVGGTSITTDVSTGWLTGDNIVIAGTEGTTQYQLRTLASNATGTSVPIVASTYATKGTSPTIADVINITSNFKIQGSSQTLAAYLTTQAGATFDVDNIEFRYMGASSTQAVIMSTSTASGGYASVKDCSVSYINTNGTGISGSTSSNGVTIDGCVGFPSITTGSCFGIASAADVYTASLKNCVAIGVGQYGFSAAMSPTVVLQNCILGNAAAGTVQAYQIYSRDGLVGGGTIDNITCYRCTTGISFGLGSTTYVAYKTTVTNVYAWRNTTGILFNYADDVTIDTATLFGNTSTNIYLGFSDNIKIANADIQAGVTSVAANGVTLYGYKSNILLERCNLGTTTAHTTADVNINDALGNYVTFVNSSFGSTTLLANQTRLPLMKSQIAFQRFNGSAGNSRVYKKYGTLFSDTTIYDSSPSSQRLTPSSATQKLISSPFQMAVANGTTATFSIKVRKSVLADGTAYNGNQPRLILRSNPSAGSTYNSDIVCATASGVAGSWETLTYTLPVAVTDNVGMEFYVDCDGTTGWVNIDTITVS
jgi:hypothetical protein